MKTMQIGCKQNQLGVISQLLFRFHVHKRCSQTFIDVRLGGITYDCVFMTI